MPSGWGCWPGLESAVDGPDAAKVAAVDLLDPKAYFTGKPRPSKRQKVRDNLLGTMDFSPVIRRTEALEAQVQSRLAERAREIVGRTGASVVARAASFMLLADSRASFEIEGERPARNRLERWGRAVLQAGRNRLSLDEILRPHNVLVEDLRFIEPGLRKEDNATLARKHREHEFRALTDDEVESLQAIVREALEGHEG